MNIIFNLFVGITAGIIIAISLLYIGSEIYYYIARGNHQHQWRVYVSETRFEEDLYLFSFSCKTCNKNFTFYVDKTQIEQNKNKDFTIKQ